MSKQDELFARRGMLTVDALTELVTSGEIDTVLGVFPDLAGSWKGKRLDARFFLADTLHHGWEGCNYLIATDVEMNVLPDFRFANWRQGYGDMKAVPDLATLRKVSWLERTAMVICDLVDEHDVPIEVSPRQILKRQLQRAAERGYTVKTGAEIEFYLFDQSYEAARAGNYDTLAATSTTIQDYHILQTTKDEPIIGGIRRHMAETGLIVEGSKGEAGYGQHEINFRYADALRMADELSIYKNGAKEIVALAGRSITFMAKWTMDDVGSSCHVHSSLWSPDGEIPLSHDAKRAYGMSAVFESYMAGVLSTHRELSLLLAHYVNSYKRFQPGSWAPTAVVWGTDNRTCGLRLVGHGSATRVESRVPGADANPYLAFAGVVAGGLHGMDNALTLPAPFVGNAYEADNVERIPWNLVQAIDLFEASVVAKEALGEEPHFHLLNSAKQEWASFNRTVTDWERMRNFERI